jgi:hypothetical protein
MFMTGFNQVTVRFGALDLVRGEWRGIRMLDFNDTNVADDKQSLM